MIENINWYPGHMKKTREIISENLKLVDVAVEVIDARIPVSSRNPVIDDILKNKKRIVALCKSDLADDVENEKWIKALEKTGAAAIPVNCVAGTGVPKFLKLLSKLQEEKNNGRARKKPLRLMIVGIPNVGKSSLINRLIGKKSAMTGDRPGITKGKQWLNLGDGIQLLDTPGILWPKFEDRETGLHLAFCGSIKDEILDRETLALELLAVLQEKCPALLVERYKLDRLHDAPLENMECIALKRGFILPGKRIDYDRASRALLDEFRSGAIGKITLEGGLW
ncbi:MAG: ribosome biogenesis GTPase YlqF [Clostridiales bacterium]|nr:ribosome biogenesis GTPase YlqF [Clostridiales bacterium]